MDLKSFYESGGDYFLPNLSVDIVIIGYHEGMLKGLLLKIGDKWLLPGGYIQRQESVDGAATRILKERTGLEDPHLKFLSVFGSEGRRFTRQWKAFAEKAAEVDADIVAVSVLLTSTMTDVPVVLDEMRNAGIRERCSFIVGGAPVTATWAEAIGADGTAQDAAGAAKLCQVLLS